MDTILFNEIMSDTKDIDENKENAKIKLINYCENPSNCSWINSIINNPNIDINKDLEEIISNYITKQKNINTITKNTSLFEEYIDGYLYSILSVRNQMLNEKKYHMIFPYLFLITHYAELVIKKVLISINKPIATHNLLSLFENNKYYLVKKIKFKEIYYNFCAKELKKLGEYALQKDFAMCFKYPLEKKFENVTISKKIMNIKDEEILQIIDSHKIFIILLQIISKLSDTIFFKDVLKTLIEYENIIKEKIS